MTHSMTPFIVEEPDQETGRLKKCLTEEKEHFASQL